MNYHFLYTYLSGAALLLSMMGLWFTVIIPGIDRWSRRFFLSYFLIFMLCCLSGFLEMVFQSYIVPDTVFVFLLFLENLLISLPMPLLTVYLLHYCCENMRSSKLFRAVVGLWAVYLVLSLSIPFISGFARITPQNQYYRGPLYPLLLLPLISILLLNFTGALRRRAQLTSKVLLSFFIATLPMTVVLFVHMFVDIYPLIDFCTVLSALSMYGLILSDQIEQDRLRQQEIILQEREIAKQQRKIASQQREIASQRANVMVLQMRPHFIYNTLASIHSLCRLDPRKARQITMDFTNYLQRNFNAVASDSTIPFSTELEHTRAYLAVEQALFDDLLVVEYDTPFTHFRLPPLTMQPIVEDAVKHGMDPDSDPLHISIRTQHTDSGTEIIVQDNGSGFDPSDDSRPQTALDNIRQRLEMMCDGKLDLMSCDGGGTTVTVTIPDRKAER